MSRSTSFAGDLLLIITLKLERRMDMSNWKKCDPTTLKENPFLLFDEKWVLIAAEKDGKVNAMTASWGSLGVLWSEQIATIYVRDSRYTRQFLDAADKFSLTVFHASYQPVLSDIMGSKSGRDCDKIKESGLSVEILDGTPVFEQAEMAFICKKIYRHPFEKDEFCDISYQQDMYAEGDYHIVFIGRIDGFYQK
jgi:flavin reductase (DIM6/NTAB) family NADH-FMN oxidoreductase RutF